jgi:predicted anti-sigma-YlaC factor YlaD
MTMDCQHIQTEILAWHDGDARSLDREVDAHLEDCLACRRFAAEQAAIDGRLAASLIPPAMSSGFRQLLRTRIARERPRVWREALPDIVHFASWGAATLLCVLVLPLDAGVVLGGGATATLLAYVALTVARTTLEDAETRRP